MKKRKLFVGLLVASAALGLASCGSKKNDDNNNNDNQQEQQKQLESISVSGYKTEFKVGDVFDKTGLVVTAKYSDNSTENVTSKATVSTPDMSKVGTPTVTVTYEGKTATYTITISANVKPGEKQLESISVSGYKTEFKVGDAFDKTGLVVTAKYSDNTEEDVTIKATVSTPDMSKAGTPTVTVTYEGKTAQYTITVTSSETPGQEKYTITFNVGEHGTAPSDILEVTTIPTELEDPVNEDKNWTFGGWYLEPTFDTKVNGGETITKTTTLYAKWLTPYEAFLAKGNIVYQNTFDEATEVECVGLDETPTSSIYGSLSDNAVDFSATNKVVIEDGKLKVLDTSSLTTNGFVMFEKITAKKVEMFVEMTVTANNGSWSMFNLIDESGSEIASVRTISSGKLGFRANGIASTNSIALAANDTIRVEISLDLVNGKVSFTYNGTSIGEADIDSLKTSLAGVKLVTAGSASRDVYIDNLGIRAENLELDKVKEALNTKIDAFYTGLDAENKYVTNGATLLEKYNAGKENITNSETIDDVVKAFEDAIAELKAVESDATIALNQTKEDAIAELEGYNADKSYTINAAAKAKAVEDGTIAITNATDAEKVAAALTAAKAAIDKIDSDDVALGKLQEAKIKELETLYVSSNYTHLDNQTSYSDAMTAAREAINNATTGEEVETAFENAKSFLNEVETNAQVLRRYKDQYKEALTEYLKPELEELASDTTQADTIAAIENAKTVGLEEIEKATITSTAKEKYDEAIETISNLYKLATEKIDTIREDAIKELTDSITQQAVSEYVAQEVINTNNYVKTIEEGYYKEQYSNYLLKAETFDNVLTPELQTTLNGILEAATNAVNNADTKEDILGDTSGNEGLVKEYKDQINTEIHKAMLEIAKVSELEQFEVYGNEKNDTIYHTAAKERLTNRINEKRTTVNNSELVYNLETLMYRIMRGYYTVDQIIEELTTGIAQTGENAGKEIYRSTLTFANTTLETQTGIIYNQMATKPEDPKKANASFAGWYKDEELTEPYNFDTPIYNDLTIYAKWYDATFVTTSTPYVYDYTSEDFTALPTTDANGYIEYKWNGETFAAGTGISTSNESKDTRYIKVKLPSNGKIKVTMSNTTTNVRSLFINTNPAGKPATIPDTYGLISVGKKGTDSARVTLESKSLKAGEYYVNWNAKGLVFEKIEVILEESTATIYESITGTLATTTYESTATVKPSLDLTGLSLKVLNSDELVALTRDMVTVEFTQGTQEGFNNGSQGTYKFRVKYGEYTISEEYTVIVNVVTPSN